MTAVADDDDLLTVQQVADLLDMRRKDVYPLIHRGRLPTQDARERGQRYRIRRGDVETLRRTLRRRWKQPNPDMTVELSGIIADLERTIRRVDELRDERNRRVAWWVDEGGETTLTIARAVNQGRRQAVTDWATAGRAAQEKER